jgi:hypothetical protein
VKSETCNEEDEDEEEEGKDDEEGEKKDLRGYHGSRAIASGQERLKSVFHSLNGNQAFGDGETGQTGNAVDIELAHDPFAVRFYCANTQV